MRLIDADELDKEMLRGHIIYESGKENLGYTTLYLGSSVRNAPTVEAEPVVQAHWISEMLENVFSPTGYVYRIACSHCRECLTVTEDSFKEELYCRHCGARMDGVSK